MGHAAMDKLRIVTARCLAARRAAGAGDMPGLGPFPQPMALVRLWEMPQGLQFHPRTRFVDILN